MNISWKNSYFIRKTVISDLFYRKMIILYILTVAFSLFALMVVFVVDLLLLPALLSLADKK